MGNIFSCFFENNHKKYILKNQLITNNFCDQCNQDFKSYIDYNRHIPFCKGNNRNKL